MGRFAALENAALEARLTRLKQVEANLEERIRRRTEQAEAQGRWVPSDPICQRLRSVLSQVRKDLAEIEQEHQRRMAAPHEQKLAEAA